MEKSHAQLIEGLGGVTAVAARLGIKPPSVSGWIEGGKNGIPDGRLIELGADIEAEVGVKRWKLRPNDWHLIWPELVGSKGAPQPPRADRRQDRPVGNRGHADRPVARTRETKGRA